MEGDYKRKRQKSGSMSSNNRGVGIQIDLLLASLVIIGAYTVFIVAGFSIISDIGEGTEHKEATVMRAGNMLADDYLVEEANNATLDRSCTAKYFSGTLKPACNHDSSWRSGDILTDSLPVDSDTNVNVTIESTEGDTVTVSGVTLVRGEEPPENFDGYIWHRYVALDADDDGQPTVHKLTIRLW